jgi:ribosomal protein L37AE/L43A
MASDTCSSCGKTMDRVMYFTVCPHCGYNYRIQAYSLAEEETLALRSLVRHLLLTMITAAGVVLIVIAVLMLI